MTYDTVFYRIQFMSQYFHNFAHSALVMHLVSLFELVTIDLMA